MEIRDTDISNFVNRYIDFPMHMKAPLFVDEKFEKIHRKFLIERYGKDLIEEDDAMQKNLKPGKMPFEKYAFRYKNGNHHYMPPYLPIQNRNILKYLIRFMHRFEDKIDILSVGSRDLLTEAGISLFFKDSDFNPINKLVCLEYVQEGINAGITRMHDYPREERGYLEEKLIPLQGDFHSEKTAKMLVEKNGGKFDFVFVAYVNYPKFSENNLKDLLKPGAQFVYANCYQDPSLMGKHDIQKTIDEASERIKDNEAGSLYADLVITGNKAVHDFNDNFSVFLNGYRNHHSFSVGKDFFGLHHYMYTPSLITLYIQKCTKIDELERKPAPDFLAEVRWDQRNTPRSFEDLRGKVVILDFWKVGCYSCEQEIPILDKIYRENKDKLAILGIHSKDFNYEGKDKRYYEKITAGLGFPQGIDESRQMFEAYGVQFVSQQYLIDKKGTIRSNVSVEDLLAE